MQFGELKGILISIGESMIKFIDSHGDTEYTSELENGTMMCKKCIPSKIPTPRNKNGEIVYQPHNIVLYDQSVRNFLTLDKNKLLRMKVVPHGNEGGIGYKCNNKWFYEEVEEFRYCPNLKVGIAFLGLVSEEGDIVSETKQSDEEKMQVINDFVDNLKSHIDSEED